MSNSITGISSAGVSNLLIKQMLMTSLGSDQAAMTRLEQQISSGQAFQLPGENPAAAQRVTSIQSLLQRKAQFQTNISTTDSFLSETDSTLSSVAALLTSINAAVVSVAGSTASDAQHEAVSAQVNAAQQQLVTLGNRQFNGRYLFAGSVSGAPPFTTDAAGNVAYAGNAGHVSTLADLNTLFTTNVSGAEAFGALSPPVQGTNLSAAANENTALANLNGGTGVAPGSISISDGHTTSVVDLSGAATLGDVATLIRNHPPTGRTLDVEVTAGGLTVRLEPNGSGAQDNLSVTDVGGTTAADLGIAQPAGVGPGPLVGNTLQPALTAATPLDDLLGARARGFLHFDGPNNDIVLEAKTVGSATTDGMALNGVGIQLVNDAPGPGQESAQFTPGADPSVPGTLTVHVLVGVSRPEQIAAAINQASGLPFTARLDPTDSNGGGENPIPPLPVVPPMPTTSGGSGAPLDVTDGLQIASGGKTYTVSLAAAKTVQDVLTAINTSGAGVLAEINATRTGIDVRSRVSGVDFSIGENGGNTAQQLGLRTFTDSTLLATLNHGQGVGRNATGANGATPGDFTITQVLPPAKPGQPAQTVQFNVDLSGAQTIGDVEQAINAAAQAAGSTIQASLAQFGNGIELNAPDAMLQSTITVTPNSASSAAVDLGLVAPDQTSAVSTPSSIASGSENSGPNSGLVFQAVNPGYAGNVQVVFQQDPTITQGNETVNYDAVAKTLTFQLGPQSTATDVITALQNDATASAAFAATLDTAQDPANDGSGVVQPQTIAITGGKPQALVGADVAPLEPPSIFNALARIGSALQANDNVALQRAAGLLTTSMQSLSNTRAELGAHEQSLTAINSQISSEVLSLKSAMSNDFDTDMAQAASDFTAAQTAYQASLMATGKMLQMTLLNYL